ncbi:flavin-containing monooxygenase [Rhodococcus daqingensis]|uniref:Flavin-containing monooxygenase n=1 Tax=Rhodococcus daqingensis TaxID=2479363 RepID=A0ABW2S6L1_9NOCA
MGSGRPSVTIIGSGFGGLGMAIALRRAGVEDITVLERADDLGGCWRENTYPGAACDVPSHLYSYSFEPKSDWSRRFAPQGEILDYLRHCARKYDVLRHIRFRAEVTGARFDDGENRWEVTLADGTVHRTDILVSACGQLSRPAWPSIPGIESFGGEIFHSATWNHDYDLDGKEVAVIGTGASAIQFVPQIAPRVHRLRLFQRGAAHVLPKPDYAYPPAVRAVFAKVPFLQRLSRWATYWTLESRALAFTRFPQLMSAVDLRFKRHLRHRVPDPEARARLTPTDPIGCKRILLSTDYYDALTRPDVEVVTAGIEAITPEGLVTADGRRHVVDAIILGTGFAATEFLAPMRITGRDGRDLHDAWAEGAEAHLGITVSGFPNLFLLYGPNTNLGHSSIVFMLESQIRYVLQAVRRLARGDVRRLEVRAEAQRASNEVLQRRIGATVWDRGCNSWYTTDSGRNTNNWPGFTFAYRLATRQLREADFVPQPADAR